MISGMLINQGQAVFCLPLLDPGKKFCLFLSDRNPYFTIIFIILSPVRIIGRVIVHFDMISCRYLIVLTARQPFSEYFPVHIRYGLGRVAGAGENGPCMPRDNSCGKSIGNFPDGVIIIRNHKFELITSHFFINGNTVLAADQLVLSCLIKFCPQSWNRAG